MATNSSSLMPLRTWTFFSRSSAWRKPTRAEHEPRAGTSEVEVLLGDQAQMVLYAGPAPGFPGLQQVNFQVESASGVQQLIVRANGRTSNTATLAVE